MGYRELLQALEEEVGRQVKGCRAEAERQQVALLEATRAELSARHEAALEQERRLQAEASARALSRARLEQERAVLVEMRRQMTDLRRAAEARLPALRDPGLLRRLVDEIVPELGDGALVFRVFEADAACLESQLRLEHPEILSRSSIEPSPDVVGGVVVCLAGRQRIDNTLQARLDSAWQQLEPEIAALVFGHDAAGGGDGVV